jgi:hypothetical protein
MPVPHIMSQSGEADCLFHPLDRLRFHDGLLQRILCQKGDQRLPFYSLGRLHDAP